MQKQAKRKPKGLGDTIASITSAIGIEPCEGCEERKEKLNNLISFKQYELTTEDINLINNFKIELMSDRTNLYELYSRFYNGGGGMPNTCTECWDNIINQLKDEIKN